jgi:short-subunit dehydrogenase
LRKQQVILITGCSSGIGEATALYFAVRNWSVVATVRKPETEGEALKKAGVTVIKLDVNDPKSISNVVAKTVDQFGKIDALVNNAGYGLVGPLESVTNKQIEQQLQTNVLGLINMTKVVVPYMRAEGGGTIVNMSSMLGRMTLPFLSLYCASKWAVGGFSEGLAFELQPYNIRVRSIEPGTIKTRFFTAEQTPSHKQLGTYETRFKKVLEKINHTGQNGVSPDRVARIVWKSVHSKTGRLHYPVDPAAKFLIRLHRFTPPTMYRWIISRTLG